MTREELSLLRSPEADTEDAQWIRVEGFAIRKVIPWNSMTCAVFGIQTGSGIEFTQA
jgi:hypothetical protein